jgi:AMMECR1 domain-containing protein
MRIFYILSGTSIPNKPMERFRTLATLLDKAMRKASLPASASLKMGTDW